MWESETKFIPYRRWGHRKSVDIDFFTLEKKNLNEVRGVLRDTYPDQKLDRSQESILTIINGVKVEFFACLAHAFSRSTGE